MSHNLDFNFPSPHFLTNTKINNVHASTRIKKEEAMKQITGADLFVKALKEEAVDTFPD